MNYLSSAINLLNKIESYGYKAYIVGGAVRDYLLKIDLYDIDITTNMPLEFSLTHFDCEDTGSVYKSIVISFEGYNFEVTNFRKDISYVDHRHPVVEIANSLEEDLVRRDFTINALALDKDFNIVDIFDGKKDIENKVIKIIGNPDKRFDEDALRILRALYFSSKLDFKIDEATLKSMIRNKALLADLSKERVYEYFTRILYSKTTRGIDYIYKYDLFSYILEFKNWLDLVRVDLEENDLAIPYFLKYNDFPIYSDKKRCLACKNLIDNNFSNYSIYKNKDYVLDLVNVLKTLKYDTNSMVKKYKNLKLKNDNELELSKEEISKYFKGKEISIAIEKVIIAILDGKLNNDKEEIKKFLGV